MNLKASQSQLSLSKSVLSDDIFQQFLNMYKGQLQEIAGLVTETLSRYGEKVQVIQKMDAKRSEVYTLSEFKNAHSDYVESLM